MRAKRLPARAGQRGAQVGREQRPLAYRVDTVLQQRARRKGADVAGGEHLRVRERTQPVVDAHEAARVEFEPAVAQPGGRGGIGEQQATVGRQHAVRLAVGRLGVDTLHAMAAQHRDATPCQHALETRTHALGVLRQQRLGGGDQRHLDTLRRLAVLAQQALQTVVQAETHLDAARATADHQHAMRRLGAQHRLLDLGEALDELVHRLDGDGVPIGALDGRAIRGRAGVEREQVEVQIGTAVDPQAARVRLQPDDARVQQPRVRLACERREIDMAFVERVVTGEIAGQHAGVGRQHVARDQRHACARRALQGEAPQHLDVRVTAADQHQFALEHLRLQHAGSLQWIAEPGGVAPAVLAEGGGSRTHQTRGTRLAGFEARAPHRGAFPFPCAAIMPARRRTGAPRARRDDADHRRGG